MLARTIFRVCALAVLAIADNTPSCPSTCTPEMRLANAKQVIKAYAVPLTQTYGELDKIPFGVPNKAGGCPLFLQFNGLCPIPASETGRGVVEVGTAIRALTSKVTGGHYTDFPQNLTTVISTNITLGVAGLIPIPVTFHEDVYLDHNTECQIYQVRSVGFVPTSILGIVLGRIGLPIPDALCDALPIKRELPGELKERFAVGFEA